MTTNPHTAHGWFTLIRAAILTLVGFGIPAVASTFFFPFSLAIHGAYLGILWIGSMFQRASGAIHSSAPSWSRWLRWALLGGLPTGVVMGVTSYITTELMPIPLFWLVPHVALLAAWAVAYVRCGPSRVVAWGVALALAIPSCGVVLIPHRWTRAVQIVLASLVIGQIYAAKFEIFDLPLGLAIGCHLWLAAITGWSCFSAAVEDAPPDDRMLEFVLAVLVGSLACSFAMAFLAPVAFELAWEYPIAIVASVLIRFWACPRKPVGNEVNELSTSIQAATP